MDAGVASICERMGRGGGWREGEMRALRKSGVKKAASSVIMCVCVCSRYG